MSSIKRRQYLSSEETSRIIDVWRERITQLRGCKKNSHIYSKMCEELKKRSNLRLTCSELRNRISNLTKKYRQERRMMGTSGGSRSSWEHFEAIHQFQGAFKSNNLELLMDESLTSVPVVRNTLASISKPKSGSAQLADYKGSSQYFDNLSFLKDQFTARKSTGNLPATVADESMHSLLDEISNDDKSEIQHSISKETREIEAPSFSQPLLNSSRKPGKAKRSEEGIGNGLLEIEKEQLRFLQEKRAKKDEDDEDLCFFKSLLPHVKNMSSSDKMEYRIKILQLTHEQINKPTAMHMEYNTENTMASTRSDDNA